MRFSSHGCRHYQAFSLIELSLVLVILGLLTGGILAGQSLIRASEIRSVASDYQRFMTANQTFRDKYFALPGDMRNATAFWDIASGTTGNDAACYDFPSTDKRTCNGDGNGSFGTMTQMQTYEGHRYWQHLANAGLIEGSFTGTGTAVTNRNYGSVVGTNAPKLKMANVLFTPIYVKHVNGQQNLYNASYSDVYYVGVSTNPPNSAVSGPFLKPEEAWNIDTKLDDGRPAFGVVTTFRSGTPGYATMNACANDPVEANAAYDLANATIACGLILTIQ